jgi:hypothetical protein
MAASKFAQRRVMSWRGDCGPRHRRPLAAASVGHRHCNANVGKISAAWTRTAASGEFARPEGMSTSMVARQSVPLGRMAAYATLHQLKRQIMNEQFSPSQRGRGFSVPTPSRLIVVWCNSRLRPKTARSRSQFATTPDTRFGRPIWQGQQLLDAQPEGKIPASVFGRLVVSLPFNTPCRCCGKRLWYSVACPRSTRIAPLRHFYAYCVKIVAAFARSKLM